MNPPRLYPAVCKRKRRCAGRTLQIFWFKQYAVALLAMCDHLIEERRVAYGDWKGIKVRHADGREGIIAYDDEGGFERCLHIRVNGDLVAKVILCGHRKDRGDKGWEWLAREDQRDGPIWYPLGDHND